MSKIQVLRDFFNQRLTAAAEEIFGAVEKTIAEYQDEVCRSKEENNRLQRQLEFALKPPDLPQLSLTVFEEEDLPEQQRCEPKWSPSLGQEDPEETAHVKEEHQEQHRTSQEETFHNDYISSSNDCVNSDYDHVNDSYQPARRFHIQSVDYGSDMPSTSSEQIKTEPDGEGYRVSELTSDPQICSALNSGFETTTEYSDVVVFQLDEQPEKTYDDSHRGASLSMWRLWERLQVQ
ncbi:hypothetical protein UPYG_G00095950 [Umbra pygmaea]|uniref:Uncharacterized protein n=1 Tax=Umbra pygmaea TaxID=75934 RepID=A0ABD0X494_UMBPY